MKIYAAYNNSLAVFENLDNDPEVRIAAAYAVGELLREKELSDKTYIILKAGMAEDNIAIAIAAAEAMGKSGIDPERALRAFTEQRVD